MNQCYCSKRLVLLTSWSFNNPGRRYKSCNVCKYFRWADPPMCERAKEIIPGLLKKINKKDSEIELQSDMINKFQLKNKEIEEVLQAKIFALEIEVMKKKSKPRVQYAFVIVCCIMLYVMCVGFEADSNEMKAVLELN